MTITKTILGSVAGLLLVASCTGGGSDPVKVRDGGLELSAQLLRDPPRETGNLLQLEVRDAGGSAVTGADVSLRYTMPAMGAMPEMKGLAAVTEMGGGRYRAEFDLPMAGGWTLELTAQSKSGSATTTFGMTTGRKGLSPTGASASALPPPAHGQEEAATFYTCSMHPSIQSETPGNCSICGMNLTPAEGSASAPPPAAHGHADEVAYYTCSMHPSVQSKAPGTCPICSMDLTPVTHEEVATGVITIDGQRRQTIGVTTETVSRRPLTVTVRAVGKVTYDETRLADISLKVRGWIGELHVDSPGQVVRAGDSLFTLYSPELYSAQEELLSVAGSHGGARAGRTLGRGISSPVEAAKRRLRLWDLSARQIDSILQHGRPLEYVPFASPASGFVIEKNVVRGATVEPGARLYRIAALDHVWIEAEIYESDLPLVAVGDVANVRLPYEPGRTLSGTVSFAYPYLDDVTRTGRVRIAVANPDMALRPDMYVDVEIEKSLGDRLAVPEDAVLYAGRRSFVFLDLGEGRLKPKAIETGRIADGWFEVLAGLSEGDTVVTSGNFLVAAESRLKLDMEHWQ